MLVSTCVQASFVLAALIGVYLLNQLITGPADDASGVSSIARLAQTTQASQASQPSLNFPTARHIDLHIILLIVLLAPAMGIQNSTARKLSVPDLPTTVLTMTLTGVVADASAHGHQQSKLGRRAVVMLALASGALTGALLQAHGHENIILMVMLGCLLAVIAMMIPHVHSDAPWVTGRQ